MNNIGLLGSLLLTFCGVPELIRTLKNRRCDIGWGFLLMWFFGELLCLFYGMDLREIPLLINYTSNLAIDRKSTRLNSSHSQQSRMPSSA